MLINGADKTQKQNYIAKNVATKLTGGLVNLGIGIPTKCPAYIPEGVEIILHSENGFTGLKSAPEVPDPAITTAGGQPADIEIYGAFFDSCTSFGLVRGGHLDATVLGALQVDAKGNIANYMIPGKLVPGMGGAMDLVVGAKSVIVAMEHLSKDGELKILDECTLPLTGENCVKYIVTEYCMLKVTDKGLVLEAKNKDLTIEEIQAATGPKLIIESEVKDMLEL